MPDSEEPDQSRREFMRRAGCLAASALTGAARTGLALGQVKAADPAPTSRPRASTVVQVRADDIVRDNVIRMDVIGEMLAGVLCRLTDRERPADAWRAILRPDDVVGIKFNGTGARELATTPQLARVLVRSLVAAGWEPRRLVLIEVSDVLREQLGTTAPVVGWSAQSHDFGSGKDCFARVLDQVTAIINVPFLKTHNIAGMTGCLKNLSHALVRSPSRYHANHCSPFIADIVAAAPIRSKLRLHLVNALRAVFDKGPTASTETMWPAGALIGSFDPVAADTVGLEMLNVQRSAHGLPPIDDAERPVPYLRDAQRRGLGTMTWDYIRHIKVRF